MTLAHRYGPVGGWKPASPSRTETFKADHWIRLEMAGLSPWMSLTSFWVSGAHIPDTRVVRDGHKTSIKAIRLKPVRLFPASQEKEDAGYSQPARRKKTPVVPSRPGSPTERRGYRGSRRHHVAHDPAAQASMTYSAGCAVSH